MNRTLPEPHPRTEWLVRSLPVLLAVAVLACGLTPLFGATFQSLSQRLPPGTDTVVAIDVSRVLDSPFARQQQWRESMAENWAKRPAVVPPGVTRLLMGAEFIPSKAETRWEVTLMEMEKMPSLQDLARAEGGNIDRVWDKDAVASPINAYFVPIDDNVLAVLTPGERSAIARWVRQPLKEESSVTSEYIRGVLAKLDDGTDVVMALDLEGAFGLPNIRRFLGNSDIEALQGKDLDALTQTIGTLKGLTLQIAVDQDINGRVLIRFGKDATELGAVAKPLMIAVLNAAGMHLDDVDQWKFAANGTEVSGTGKLSDASLRRLIGVVQSPIPAIVAANSPQAAAPADPATASQRYFKATSLIIDNLRGGDSLQETSTWFGQAAKRIDRLPILNVDPALVEWGTLVSMKLKEAGGVARSGQTRVDSRVAGVADPEYSSYYYDNDGNYHSDKRDTVALENARRQRRQAALEQKAQAQEQGLQILNEVNGSRQKVRAEMTAKYNIEF